jgi:RNA polymerase sigma factor (sigma-70 family)
VDGAQTASAALPIDRRTRAVTHVRPAEFEILFEAERAPMVRVAYLITRSTAAAEDVVDDAFLRVLQRWQRLSSPGGYLRTIVVRSAMRSKRRRRREEVDVATLRTVPTHVDFGVDEMWDALGRLPVKQRAALVLRYYSDYSHEQIAGALHCTVATARSLTHRGITALRKDAARWNMT